MGSWGDDKDELLRRMAGEGASLREIAAATGVSHVTAWKFAKRLGVKVRGAAQKPAPDPPQPAKVAAASHLEPYRRARRGFHVPAHLENEYFELLKAGVSIAEACRRLKINTNIARGNQ